MRSRRLPAIALCLFVSVLGWSRAANGHGGLPVTQRILRQGGGETMYVPVVYWGVWVGAPGQPWRWICEEVMNTNRNRRLALSADGTFYATDTTGLTVSTDQGCTWKNVKGSEPATLRISDVVADPIAGATAWLTTADGGHAGADGGIVPAANGLFVTRDHGATFTRNQALATLSARFFLSVLLSADARTIYVTSSQSAATPDPRIHRSADGGGTFNTGPIGYQLDGVTPFGVEVLAIDPRNPMVVYVRAQADVSGVGRQALLRSIDGGASFVELLKRDGVMTPSGAQRGIDGVAIDAAAGRVLVATAGGLLAGTDPGAAPSLTLSPTSSLSQSQCVDVHGGAVYACASNYAPDQMAIGRSSDGAASFQKVLQFVDTQGPVSCPAGTPVGDQCPLYWQMYGSQLGINVPPIGTGDGGAGGGGSGCGCSLGARPVAGGAFAALVFVGAAALVRRARRT